MQLFKSRKRNEQKGKVLIPMLETKVSFSQTCHIKQGNLDKRGEKNLAPFYFSDFFNIYFSVLPLFFPNHLYKETKATLGIS